WGDHYTLNPDAKKGGPVVKRPENLLRGGRYLSVWETETGKQLRQWSGSPTAVAFHPSKPILAIFEPNGDTATRIGLWDFAADAEKKGRGQLLAPPASGCDGTQTDTGSRAMPPPALRATPAAEIMTAGPPSLHATATVDEAIAFLTEKGFGAAVVIDEAG